MALEDTSMKCGRWGRKALFFLTNQSGYRQHKTIINILNSNTYKGGKMIVLGLLAGLILVDTATKKRKET
jgi:hypothetical protein